MKILQVGLGNNPGGMEAFVMNYFRELAKQGITFDFVCMYDKIAYEEEIRRLGGRVFYVPNVKKDYFGYVKAFQGLLQREQYDIIHVNMLSAANIEPLRLAKKVGSGKVIAHSHNASAPGTLRKILDRLNRPKLNRYADQKFACSETAGRWLFGRGVYEAGNVTLVSNAIDTKKYSFSLENREEMRDILGIGNGILVGHVGRFQIQKNHEAIARIFYEVQKKQPEARLCLIGDGELKEQIHEKFREYGILDKVIFAGVCPDVERYLSAMDVFLFPSLFEGLPFTLLEAQANGLPCVVSDRITEEAVITEKIISRLSLDRSDEEWASAVIVAAKKGREDKEAAVRAIEMAHFDIHQEAGRLLELYEKQGEKHGKQN